MRHVANAGPFGTESRGTHPAEPRRLGEVCLVLATAATMMVGWIGPMNSTAAFGDEAAARRGSLAPWAARRVDLVGCDVGAGASELRSPTARCVHRSVDSFPVVDDEVAAASNVADESARCAARRRFQVDAPLVLESISIGGRIIAVQSPASPAPAVAPQNAPPARPDAPGGQAAPTGPGSDGARKPVVPPSEAPAKAPAATPAGTPAGAPTETPNAPPAGDGGQSLPAGASKDGTERIDTSAQNNPSAGEMTPALEASVARGLEFLKGLQNDDGSFGRGRYGRHVGITGLCAIAFMADGHIPGRGKYGDVVKKALDFVVEHATETGLLAAEATNGPMYGHGFAALFLGEAYGMSPDDDRTRDALTRAVQLIVNSQNDEGGWRYNPVPYDADVSVTICQIMALRSARNAGIKVPKETIDAAVRYVKECQNADGGFRYMKEMGGSAWPRTAAGIASLFYAGIYKDEAIDRGLDYLFQNAMPTGNGGPLGQAHYFYGHYYAVQAMYLAGGDRWAKWWPAIRDELLARQESNGMWNDHQAGEAYGTAMALIILQMPKRYLPIFQK